jgi:hypothetical protein
MGKYRPHDLNLKANDLDQIGFIYFFLKIENNL